MVHRDGCVDADITALGGPWFTDTNGTCACFVGGASCAMIAAMAVCIQFTSLVIKVISGFAVGGFAFAFVALGIVDTFGI